MFGGRRKAVPVKGKDANLRIYRWKTLFGYHFTYGSPEKNLHDPDPGLKLVRRAGERDMQIIEVTHE